MGDLPALFVKLKAFSEMFSEDEIKAVLEESCKDISEEIDFESFLRVSQRHCMLSGMKCTFDNYVKEKINGGRYQMGKLLHYSSIYTSFFFCTCG